MCVPKMNSLVVGRNSTVLVDSDWQLWASGLQRSNLQKTPEASFLKKLLTGNWLSWRNYYPRITEILPRLWSHCCHTKPLSNATARSCSKGRRPSPQQISGCGLTVSLTLGCWQRFLAQGSFFASWSLRLGITNSFASRRRDVAVATVPPRRRSHGCKSWSQKLRPDKPPSNSKRRSSKMSIDPIWFVDRFESIRIRMPLRGFWNWNIL